MSNIVHLYHKLDLEQKAQLLDVAANRIFKDMLINTIHNIEKELIHFEIDNADVHQSLRYLSTLKAYRLQLLRILQVIDLVLKDQQLRNVQATQVTDNSTVEKEN